MIQQSTCGTLARDFKSISLKNDSTVQKMLLDHVWYFQKKFTADWSVVTWRTCRFGCNQKFIWYSIGWEENYCFDMRICYSFPQCQQSKPDAVIKKRQQNVTLGNGFASWILLVIQIFHHLLNPGLLLMAPSGGQLQSLPAKWISF